MISFIQEVTWFPASILLRQVESKPAALRKQGHKSAEIFKRVQNTIERWWGHQWLNEFDSWSPISNPVEILPIYCLSHIFLTRKGGVWRISALQVSWMIHEKIFIQVVRAIQTLFASTDINQLKSLRECKNNCMLMRPPMVWLISTHALIPQIQLKYFPFVDQISSGHMFNLKFLWSHGLSTCG